MTQRDIEPAPKAARSSMVQSVERVFEMLEITAAAGGQISLSALSEKTDLPMTTIHRLLRTCVSLGYVRQLPNRQYALGAKLISLGERAGRQLGRSVGPQLQRLVLELGESANMAMLEENHVVYIAQQPSPHAMRMFTEVGRRVDLHDTGVGKAILATMSDDEVRTRVGRTSLPAATPKSLTTMTALLADLQAIRERGYSIDDEEQELGVRCLAVSLPDTPAPMAVSVSGPLSRVDEAFEKRAVPVLQEAALEVSEHLKRG